MNGSRKNLRNESSLGDIDKPRPFSVHDLDTEDIEELDAATSAVENFDIETQKALLKAFEMFYEQESEVMISALEHSREEIKDSMVDLVVEQDKYKEELQRASEGRYTFERKKENSIPLAVYLRRKRGGSAYPNFPMTPDGSQHPTDKMAVEKYLRKRERQKIAEENRLNRERTNLNLEAETKKILKKLQGVDLTKEKERERQLEKIQQRLRGKQMPQKDDKQVANEIMENYSETNAAFERDKILQQQRFRARLSAAQNRRALSPGSFEKISKPTNLNPRAMPKSVSTNNVSVVDV